MPTRHAELVSASIYPPSPSEFVERWILKRVQDDAVSGMWRFSQNGKIPQVSA